jgi:hypothetical protein
MRIVKQTGFIFAAMFLMLFAACGGNGGNGSYFKNTNNTQGVNISITQPAGVRVGASTTLSVTRRNTPDFTLSVDPPVGSGCVKSGNNAVTCTPTTAGTYTITVTATADTTKKANTTLTVTVNVSGTEVKIPVTIALSKSIAGVQFEFKPGNGLEYVSFEKSDAVKSATVISTVKDGNTYVGLMSANNNYTPTNGALSVGYLVFSWSGASGQSVTMTEVKLGWFASGDVLGNETITDVYTVQVPLPGGSQGFRIGF